MKRENCFPSSGTHAVVIGGSLAGLMAARVLSDHFSRVTILERDAYSNAPELRGGVPQACHVHVLLLRGQHILESLLPGFCNELMARGAALVDSAADFAWFTPAGWAPRFQSGLPFLAASRPLIEWVVHQFVERLPNVSFMENVAVIGLRGNETASRVTGVRLQFRAKPDMLATFDADLVVDASGRASRAPEWLSALGCVRPAETIVDGHLGYASRIYRRTPGQQADWRASFSQAAPPAVCRTGLAFPLEGDRWIVTLAGGGHDYPPVDENGFAEFARSLPNPHIFRVITTSEPLSPIRSHRGTQNRMRHYEKIKMPAGFLALGDAACAFNPVYGQGMSTAAIGAQLLQNCLKYGRLQRFQQKLAKEMRPAWMFATSEDVRYPGVEGTVTTLATRFMHWYIDGVLELSVRNTKTRARLLQVQHMLRPPSLLFQPSTLLRVMPRALARQTPSNPKALGRLTAETGAARMDASGATAFVAQNSETD